MFSSPFPCRLLVLVLALATAAVIVTAQDIPPSTLIPSLMNLNGGWSKMPFNVTLSPWVFNVFKVNAPVPISLVYSDAYCPGKMVSIYVNNTFLMDSTSVPFPPVAGFCNPRIDLPSGTLALGDIFSHAYFNLPAGEHEIAVKIIQNDPKVPSGVMFLRAYIPPNVNCKKHDI